MVNTWRGQTSAEELGQPETVEFSVWSENHLPGVSVTRSQVRNCGRYTYIICGPLLIVRHVE